MHRFASIALIIVLISLMSCAEDIPDPITMEELEELLGGSEAGEQATEEHTDLPERITGKDGAPMVLIPAGEFQMGSNDSKDNQKPVHTVYLDAFYIDIHEVTNAQYRKFVQATGHREPVGKGFVEGSRGEWNPGFRSWSDKRFNGDDQPVVCVNWEDAMAYCKWAGKRLPTEAEWEKAARGGLVGKKYVWGNVMPPPRGAGNFADGAGRGILPDYLRVNGYDDGYIYCAPVGSFDANGYGLYDMAGNVWEWTADWYDENYYANSPRRNPAGPIWGQRRVNRGSSWYNNVPVAFRDNQPPTFATSGIGFRCAQDVTP